MADEFLVRPTAAQKAAWRAAAAKAGARSLNAWLCGVADAAAAGPAFLAAQEQRAADAVAEARRAGRPVYTGGATAANTTDRPAMFGRSTRRHSEAADQQALACIHCGRALHQGPCEEG